MNIDLYINNISSDRIIGSGFEKKCYDFGEVVLLESRYLSKNKLEEEINSISTIKGVLDSININGYKIYDYKVFNGKVYVLENKVKGSSLQNVDFNGSVDDYIRRLGELNNYNLLKKFVMDSLTIINNGLSIDFGRPNNFLYDKDNGISFLDLGVLESPFDTKNLCFYILYNIIYNYCEVENYKDYEIISFYYYSIYDKLYSIFIELGFDESMCSESPNGIILSFIKRKLDNLLIGLEKESTKVY